MVETRVKDGVEWVIGGPEDVAWIADDTVFGRTIDVAIPPVFASYCTLLLPELPDRGRRGAYEEAVVALLRAHAAPQPWWLGYLDTGVSDTIFPDAPFTLLYANWPYALVQAGPEQALAWRADPAVGVWNGPLPDLIFPADHTWLLSTLWDDGWSCIGGPEPLVAAFLADPLLGPLTRRVGLGEDVTPPGHIAF